MFYHSVTNRDRNSTTTVTWDAEERATSVSGTGGGTYTYNGIGQRVRKVEGSNTFNYTRESDAIDGAVLSDGAASYTQSSQGLVAENRGGTSSYYHSDVLGTTRSLTSSTQTKTDTFQFDAFGLSTGRSKESVVRLDENLVATAGIIGPQNIPLLPTMQSALKSRFFH